MTTAKTGLKPTDEQQAVIDAVAKPSSGSVMVNAYAGCAKSSTLEMASPTVRVPALALAFNKKIARDLEPRLPGNFSVKTLNGLGHGALARGLPATRLTLDDRKLGKLVTQVAKDHKIDLSSEQWDQVRQLVSSAMAQGIVPEHQGTGLVPDTEENWLVAANGSVDQEDFEFIYDLAHQTLAMNNELTRSGTISFDDQVYGSVCLGGRFAQFPVVFVDEAQDLSPLNHAMLARSLRADGRLVAVGDTKQAIYAFRGADSASMSKIRQLRPEWVDRPLATTFRCPKVIVARQQGHAPGFKAWFTNPDGTFRQFVVKGDEAVATWTWKDLVAHQPSPQASLAVLCRNNAPLLAMAFRLIRGGIGPQMLGRDIGKGLSALSKKIAPQDELPVDRVASAVEAWRERESSLARANGREEKLAGIDDRAECLFAVLNNASCQTAGDLRAMLTRLFAREQGQIMLSSIHRAKGLEWDTVLILDPWRIPSRQARQAQAAGDPRPLEQELNLRYVAETRTRHTLLHGDLEGFQG